MPSLRRLRAAAIILPVVVFGVWGAASWHLVREAAVSEAKLKTDLVREYALRVLEAQRILLDEAAAIVAGYDLGDLSPGDERRIHEQLKTLRGRLQHFITVAAVAPDGHMVAGGSHYPVRLDVSEREFFRNRAEIGEAPKITRLQLRPSGTDALLLARWQRPGEADPGGLVVAAAQVEALTTFLSQIADAPDAAASIFRSDGLILLRKDPAEDPIQLGPDTLFRTAIARGDGGVYETRAASDGITRIYAFERIGEYPLYGFYGVPRAALIAEWARQQALVGAVLAVLAVLAYSLVAQVRRRIVAEAARQRSHYDRKLLHEARRAAERNRLMMEEAHHRIKNSLQLVSSFISLGRKDSGDVDSVLHKVSERVRAISAVHDLLYENNMSGSVVDLVPLLRRVCESPGLTPSDADVSVVFSSGRDTVTVPAATAVSIILVVVELVINSGKHAFAGRASGRIAVGLDTADEEIRVTVADDGVGLPEERDTGRTSGLRLVDGILRQLGGTLERRNDGGAHFVLSVRHPDAVRPRPVPAETGASAAAA